MTVALTTTGATFAIVAADMLCKISPPGGVAWAAKVSKIAWKDTIPIACAIGGNALVVPDTPALEARLDAEVKNGFPIQPGSDGYKLIPVAWCAEEVIAAIGAKHADGNSVAEAMCLRFGKLLEDVNKAGCTTLLIGLVSGGKVQSWAAQIAHAKVISSGEVVDIAGNPGASAMPIFDSLRGNARPTDEAATEATVAEIVRATIRDENNKPLPDRNKGLGIETVIVTKDGPRRSEYPAP